MNHKQIVKNNKIVYANWFLRQGEAIWDFLYFHVLPIRTWQWMKEQKDRFVYALERAFTGFDRRISWGHESSIAFYKRLLSDLYKNAHGWPGSAKQMREICPVEWKEVEEKWAKKLPEGKTVDDLENSDPIFPATDLDGIEKEVPFRDEYFEDGFQCWKKYIKNVLHHFEEADYDTCSKNARRDELYSKMKNPLDKKERTVVEHNGMLFYQYPSLGDSEEDNEQRKILKELREIDEYQTQQLELGMKEVARNIIYLND